MNLFEYTHPSNLLQLAEDDAACIKAIEDLTYEIAISRVSALSKRIDPYITTSDYEFWVNAIMAVYGL